MMTICISRKTTTMKWRKERGKFYFGINLKEMQRFHQRPENGGRGGGGGGKSSN